MKLLLENWSEVKDQLTSLPFLITDYDGTLTPIVDRPKDAKLSEDMRENLSKLAESCPVAIVSGRSLEDVREMVGLDNVHYAGNHGFEISGPETEFVKEEAKRVQPTINELCREIEKRTGSIEGVIIENKGTTASVHYRLVREGEVPQVKEIFGNTVKPYQEEGVVRVTRGKKVLEIRPNLDWDKGKAVLWLLESTGLVCKTFPIYMGDDVTDEDAFQALKGRGLGILISEEDKETEAEYRLKNVEEVKIFLKNLIELQETETR